MAEFFNPNFKKVRVGIEGTKVFLLIGGKRYDFPYEAALEISRALRIQAKKVEEIVNAEKLIADSAILKRVGANIGLTNNPDIHKEAEKEAAWNKDLRRKIPSNRAKGIGSKERFGRPTIRKEKLNVKVKAN